MSSKSATLAKSLHTVSVLVSVARHVSNQFPNDRYLTPAAAVTAALDILGYRNAADPHGLVDRAIMQLAKDAQ